MRWLIEHRARILAAVALGGIVARRRPSPRGGGIGGRRGLDRGSGAALRRARGRGRPHRPPRTPHGRRHDRPGGDGRLPGARRTAGRRRHRPDVLGRPRPGGNRFRPRPPRADRAGGTGAEVGAHPTPRRVCATRPGRAGRGGRRRRRPHRRGRPGRRHDAEREGRDRHQHPDRRAAAGDPRPRGCQSSAAPRTRARRSRCGPSDPRPRAPTRRWSA